MKQYSLFPLVLLLACTFFGCNRGPEKPEGLPDLQPVTLQLTQDGKPLADAEVILRSDEIGRWSCGGRSNEKGVVVIHTHGRFSGAPLGKHKVVVSKIKSSDSENDSKKHSPGELNEMAEKRQAKGGFGQTVYLVERKYSDILTTPLEIEVKTGNNRFDLDVGPVVEIVQKNTSPMGR